MPLELQRDTALARRLHTCWEALNVATLLASADLIALVPPAPLLDILVIDDDRDTRILLERVGTAAGYAVDHAPNGVSGLEMVLATAPRLVLLDVHMPDGDGRAVADQLRALPLPLRPAILLMTADPDLLTSPTPIPVVAKPFDLPALLTQVATLLAPPA